LLADGLPFYGMTLTGAYWRDIGTPSEYRRANIDVLEERVRLVSGRSNGVPPDATVGAGVTIDGDVRFGTHAVIGENARIVGPTVIGNDARIGAGAVIERSILWDAVTIGARTTVRDSIIGNDYAVLEGAFVTGSVVANQPDR
jgi:mannose-1-phosphate guanylyltransferase